MMFDVFIHHSAFSLTTNQYKLTLHSYREFNLEELTKWCRNGYIGPPKMVRVSSVSIKVHFGSKSSSGVPQVSVQPLFRISHSTTGQFPVGSELRFWVCRGVEVVLCEIWATSRGLGPMGPCDM